MQPNQNPNTQPTPVNPNQQPAPLSPEAPLPQIERQPVPAAPEVAPTEPPAAAPPPPPLPSPNPVVPSTPPAQQPDPSAQPPAAAKPNLPPNPTEAGDVDVIEKAWVDQADKIIDHTKGDPYVEEEAVESLQQDYLKKRFGHDVKKPENQ